MPTICAGAGFGRLIGELMHIFFPAARVSRGGYAAVSH
jgi:H+/Cl- antiporter ClcA